MKRRLVVLVTFALLATTVFVGNAAAAAPPMTPAEAQAAGQQAKSGQDADTTAGSGQYQPSNQAAPVRIGSRGDGGDVTQTNASAAAAISANENKTDQSADQTQAGGSGGSYGQAAGQEAKSEQDASSEAESTQKSPRNVNVPIRILSPGDDGDVTQTNASAAAAASANGNETDQSVDQTQSGGSAAPAPSSGHGSSCGCEDSSYSQAAGQEAKSDQSADSKAESTQKEPSNVNVPIRIGSRGDGGDVTQTNASLAGAASANGNKTDQSVDQTQSGGSSKDSKCCSDASYSQAAGQESKSDQSAESDAKSTQKQPSNVNVPIRILSPGDDGDVTQTNASAAGAASLNGNKTDQSVDQSQSGKGSSCCSDASYSQAAGQEAKNDQWADSDADSKQEGASNVNVPVRIGSKGDGGNVTQTNASAALAASLNGNKTDQSVDQSQGGGSMAAGRSDSKRCGCSSDALYTQASGQEAKNEQGARSDANSTQKDASNVNVPVRIGSKGDDGDVTQTNASLAAAISANGNKADQSVEQDQYGASKSDSRCGCSSDDLYVQAAGQSAKNDQWADSDADSTQKDASNVNAPVRIDSKGDDGDVTQTNASLAAAISANGNKADQSIDQDQGGSGHGGSDAIYVQAAGQEAKSEQGARSDADSTQKDASNVNAPVRIGSKGDGGDVTQTNLSAALAASLNGNETDQSVEQDQSGRSKSDPKCGCGSDALYVQAAGQEAKNDQWADSEADSKQTDATNTSVPVRIHSKGDDGDVTQTNLSAALAASLNGNRTDQSVDQTQGGSKKSEPSHDPKCGCSDALYIQAAGQEAKNDQSADSRARSDQYGASNVWDPVRIGSKGGHGDVTQTNASLVAGIAASGNATTQHGSQTQAGSGLAEQTLGQSTGSKQKAGSDARSKQGKPKSKKASKPYGGRHLDD